MLMFVAVFATPAMADDGGVNEQIKNVRTGGENMKTAVSGMFTEAHDEASKNTGLAKQAGGVAVGTIKGARKALYHVGAGAIELLTFWIPKKGPIAQDK